MNTSTMTFDDLTLITVPVKLGGKDYVLREASGDADAKWRNLLMQSMRLNSDGKPSSMEKMADTESYLVSLCLFEAGDKGAEKAVPLATIRSWPAKVVKALFERAKDISGLQDKETKDTLVEKMDRLKEQLDEMDKEVEDESVKKPHRGTMAGSV